MTGNSPAAMACWSKPGAKAEIATLAGPSAIRTGGWWGRDVDPVHQVDAALRIEVHDQLSGPYGEPVVTLLEAQVL